MPAAIAVGLILTQSSRQPLPSRLSRPQHCVSHRYYCVALLDASVTDAAKKYQCRLDSGEHL